MSTPENGLNEALPIIGYSESIKRVRLEAVSAAQHDVNVLILGESGVGKDLLANLIHFTSQRKFKPLKTINCSAIPEELLENEIFGHNRGSFTGAIAPQSGKLEQANGGTLFLNEIGEMSVKAQCKLLGVLEKKKIFERLGGSTPISVDVRIIAATNADLERKVREKTFREDLFYRLKEFTITMPPLRERGEDIKVLLNYYLEKLCERFGKSKPEMDSTLMAGLMTYAWPGNVRELENALIQALVRRNGSSGNLSLADFPHLKFSARVETAHVGIVKTEESQKINLKEVGVKAAEAAEKEVVLKVLKETGWKMRATARRLKICHKTLLNKLTKWQIKPVIGSADVIG